MDRTKENQKNTLASEQKKNKNGDMKKNPQPNPKHRCMLNIN